MSEKICRFCGETFVDKTKNQCKKYCSRSCGNRAYQRNNYEKMQGRSNLWAKNNSERIKKYASEYYKENREKRLEYARSHVISEESREKKRAYSRAYDKKNPEKACEKSARRRSRLREVFVEKVSYEEIYVRDSCLCQICGETVDKDKKWPDPMSPSIDHIIPISRGGTHESRNVQLTHLSCNLRKWAKI